MVLPVESIFVRTKHHTTSSRKEETSMAETMNGLKRTSYCGKLSKANVGNSEVVCGWVQKQRDKGHLIFIDLRDRTGVVQLVFDDDTNREVFEKAASVHARKNDDNRSGFAHAFHSHRNSLLMG